MLLTWCVEMFDTRVMEQLLAYIDANGPKTDLEWSEVLGISRSHFTMIRRGKSVPGRKLIATIAERTNGQVPVTAWFADAERAA
jgi:hypothetical protein